MKLTWQIMEACMDKGVIRSYTRAHTHTLVPLPSPTHTHKPVTTAKSNHAIIGKESHRNLLNHFISHGMEKDKDERKKKGTSVHHSTLHCTLKPSLAPWGEAGWGRGVGEVCRTGDIFCYIPSSELVLPCGHLLVLWWALVSWEQGPTMALGQQWLQSGINVRSVCHLVNTHTCILKSIPKIQLNR